MMPRRSPPTAIGFPLSFGSAACSTDAKNASASRWTIIGVGHEKAAQAAPQATGEAVGTNAASAGKWSAAHSWLHHTQEGDLHALDHEFLRGNEILKTRVLRFKERFAAMHHVTLQRRFAVE